MTTTKPTTTVKRLSRATLAAQVAEQLRAGILDGSFGPGAQLNEAELAEQFAISRGPVREGLQRLIQEGLLRSEPHRGVFVPVLSEQDLIDVYFAREAVESAAIRRIMAAASTSAVDALTPVVDEMTAAAAAGRWATWPPRTCGSTPRSWSRPAASACPACIPR